jgi:hypothetical protein
MLGMDFRAMKSPTAQQTVGTIYRSLQKPEAKGFFNFLASKVSNSSVVDYLGKPLGQRMPLDRSRVNKTGEHIIRGLYYKETNKPVPKHAQVAVESEPNMSPAGEGLQSVALVFELFGDKRSGVISDAFSYAAAFGYSRSAWIMLLYGYHFWIGTIDERDPSEHEAIPKFHILNVTAPAEVPPETA